jgi:hypothetical protein
MPNISYVIRQCAALVCALTLAWDYCRAPEIIELFSIWTLGLHFVYFQLPLQSRALAFFHSSSFVSANVMLASYLYLLMNKPSLEIDHMEQWDVSYQTIIARAFLIHASPLLFHSLDITFNQEFIVSSYQTKAKKMMFVWSFMSYGSLGVLFDLVNPENEETRSISGMEIKNFLFRSRIISLFVTIFAFSLLYSMILKKAYPRKARSRSM